jgi:hypothetical protein
MRLAPCCGCWKFVKIVAAIKFGGWQMVPGLSPAVQFEASAQMSIWGQSTLSCSSQTELFDFFNIFYRNLNGYSPIIFINDCVRITRYMKVAVLPRTRTTIKDTIGCTTNRAVIMISTMSRLLKIFRHGWKKLRPR